MTNYNILAIAGRISYLRRQNSLTLDEAAQKLGIQRRSLSNIEYGAKGCSIDLLAPLYRKIPLTPFSETYKNLRTEFFYD